MPVRTARFHYGAAWSTSEKVSRLSDGAALLWRYLTDEAGDDGEVPYALPVLRSITASRDWSHDQRQAFVEELRQVGALTEVECNGKPFLLLYRFADFNSPPVSGKYANRARHFSGWECRIDHMRTNVRYGEGKVNSPDLHGEEKVKLGTGTGTGTGTLNRNMNSKGFAPKSKKRPHLTETEILELHTEYDAAMTGPRVTQEIAASLDHEAAYKRGKSGSWKLYVSNWLRRAVAPNSTLFTPPSANGSAPDKYELERQRIAKLGVAPSRLPPKVPP